MDGITRRNPFMKLDDLQNRLATLFGRAPSGRTWARKMP
jgi:hypothetical protein